MPSVLPSELTLAARAVLAMATLAAATTPLAQAAGVPDQGTWQNTLQGRDLDGNLANGFEAYYDTDLNITWLADANYAKTSGYDADGLMNWAAAKTWAANLNVNGITGWRLPDVKPVNGGSFNLGLSYNGSTDFGYNITSTRSELAHLYYVTLGNKAYYNPSGNAQAGYGLSNTGPFKSVQSYNYWFGVEYTRIAPDAWSFDTGYGTQSYLSSQSYDLAAWAVRQGDVAAVPEPQPYALALAGLAAVLVVRKRRHA